MSMFITKRWTKLEQWLGDECFNSDAWCLLADLMDLGFGLLTTASSKKYEAMNQEQIWFNDT